MAKYTLSRMTMTMEEHWSGYKRCGEDYGSGDKPGDARRSDEFANPFKELKIIHSYEANDGSGNISYFNAENNNGYKLNGRIIHGDTNFSNKLVNKTLKFGEAMFKNHASYNPMHIHFEIHDNSNKHLNQVEIQANRANRSIVKKLVDAQKLNASSGGGSISKPPTSSAKRIKAIRNGKNTDNGTFYFDIKYKSNFNFSGKILNVKTPDVTGSNWGAKTTWNSLIEEGTSNGGNSGGSNSSTFKLKRSSSQSHSGTYTFKNSDKNKFTISGSKYKVKDYVKDVDGQGWIKDTTFIK